jgi:hypothetical protein
MGSGYIGLQGKGEGLQREKSLVKDLQGDMDRDESWEGLTDEEGSSTGLQDGWGGFPGENEAWEGSREEREGFAGRSEAWEGLQEIRKSPQEPRESPQEQYCSSCNRKKPLTDFGQFFTYNTYRERNKKANRVRKAKQKRAIPSRPKATNEQLEYVIQALAPTSEYRLGLNFATRPVTIENYLNKSS